MSNLFQSFLNDIIAAMPQTAAPAPAPLPNFAFNPFAVGPGGTNGMMALPLSQQAPAIRPMANVQQPQAPAASSSYPGATGNALPPNMAMGGAGWPDAIAHKIAPANQAAAPPSDAVSRALQCMTANGPANFVVTSTSDGHSNPTDPHYQGKAFDVTADPAYRAAIMQAAANCGAVYQQDEYVNPSPSSNGGHLHFQLRSGKGGAIGPYRSQTSN